MKQGLDLIEPAADLNLGELAMRPRGPKAHIDGAALYVKFEAWLNQESFTDSS